MKHRLKLTAACAAVMAAFSLPSHAQIYGAGASAIKNNLLNGLITDDCDNTVAGGIQVYDNKTATTNPGTASGSVFELHCTPVAGARLSTSPIIVSYDTTGGSWKAFSATTSAVFAAAQAAGGLNAVKTINESGCFNSAVNNFTRADGTVVPVTYSWGCTATALATTDTVTFGLTDVESKLFSVTGENQPLQDGTWNTGAVALVSPFTPATELTGFGSAAAPGKPVFGVVFGVAASQPLWLAMQTDQIKAGLLPGCTSGTTSVVSATEACTPFISKEQYASIVSLSGGTATNGAQQLFHSTSTTLADYSLVLARRDRGSGTQASSNAYFLNIGCASSATEPADSANLPSNTAAWGGAGGNTVTYGPSTDDIIAELQLQATTPNGVTDCTSTNPTCGTMTYPASSFVIGVVSGEKFSATSITAAGALGSSTAPWGFLRLDGFLPKEDSVQDGLYQYSTTEHLHCNANASGDGKQLCNDMAGITTGATSLLTYANTGVFPLTGSTKSGHVVNYTNIRTGQARSCAALKHN